MKNQKIFATSIIMMFLSLSAISASAAGSHFQINLIYQEFLPNNLGLIKTIQDKEGNYFILSYYDFTASKNHLKVYQSPKITDVTTKPLWEMTNDKFGDGILISDNGNRFFYCEWGSNITAAYNPNSSTPIWSKNVYQTPFIHDGALNPNGSHLLIDHRTPTNRFVSLVNGDTGDEIWKVEYPMTASVTYTKLMNNNDAYIVLSNRTIEKYDAQKSLIWSKNTFGNFITINQKENLVIVRNSTSSYFIVDPDTGDIISEKQFTDLLIHNILFDDEGDENNYAVIIGASPPAPLKILIMNPNSMEAIREIPDLPRLATSKLTNNLKYILMHTTSYAKNFLVIDTHSGQIVANRTYGYEDDSYLSSKPNKNNQVTLLSQKGQLIVLKADYHEESEQSILEKLLAQITDSNNWMILGIALFAGMLIGGLLFGRRKKY